jgi:hypothetical protein
MCLFAKLVEEPFSENCLARRKLDVAAQSALTDMKAVATTAVLPSFRVARKVTRKSTHDSVS